MRVRRRRRSKERRGVNGCTSGKSSSSLPVSFCVCPVLQRKIFRFYRIANRGYGSPIPPRHEGRIAIVTKREAGDAVDASVPKDERHICVRRSRVVPAPRRWRQVGDDARITPMTGARKPGPRGERDISRKTTRAGDAGLPPLHLYARVRFLFALCAHGTAGAACTRHSLRPRCWRVIRLQSSGEIRRENVAPCRESPLAVMPRESGASSIPENSPSSLRPRRTGSPGQAGR